MAIIWDVYNENNFKFNMSEALRKEILDKLDSSGAISTIRSQIKSHIIQEMKNQKRSIKHKTEFDLLTPYQRQAKGNDVMLLTHLIIEFLQFYELQYTLPVFKDETNIKEEIKKETLVKDSQIPNYDENMPILLQLLNLHLREKNKESVMRSYEDPFYKKEKEINYGSGLGLLSGSGVSGLSSYSAANYGGSLSSGGNIQGNTLII